MARLAMIPRDRFPAVVPDNRGADESAAFDYTVEIALLALLLDQNAAVQTAAAEGLRAEDFADAVNQRLYTAVCDAVERGDRFNLLSATLHLMADPALTEAEGRAYANQLGNAFIAGSSVAEYARAIVAFSVRRQVDALREQNLTVHELHAELDRLVERAGGKGSARFHLVPFSSFALSTEPAFLIDGILPNSGIAVIYGPPKSGKSFLSFDMLLHIATGRSFRGRRVMQGAVVYVALEGERGIGARVAAARAHYGLDEAVPFHIITARLGLASDAARLIRDIAVALHGEPVVAVAIDTLNRSIEGSESSDEDMGAYVKALDRIREKLGCLVVVVHHSGIDTSRPRGHTSLSGAADAQIAVCKSADGIVTATVELMKDGEAGTVIASRLLSVQVGVDADNQPITSCVVVEADDDGRAAQRLRRPLSDRQQNALTALRNLFADNDLAEVPPASRHIPAGRKCLLRPKALVALESAGLVAGVAEQKRRREAIGRVLEQLQARGFLGVWQDWLWLTD